MFYCSKCHYTTENACNFCPVCGAKIEVVQAEAPAPKVSKPKMIIGGIVAVSAFVTALCAVFLSFAPALLHSTELFGIKYVGYLYAVFFSIVSIPGSIVGFLLSNSVYKAGGRSGFSKVARILGLFALIIACIAVLGIIVNHEDIADTFRYAASIQNVSFYL